MSKMRKTVERKRRIIYQDAGAGEKPSHNPKATVEGFLATAFDAVPGSQVDTWTYNVGNCWLNEDGTLYAWGQKRWQTAHVFGDANQIIVDAVHNAGIEIFASLKMNDAHCAFVGVDDPLKISRPDLLIGEHFPGKYPHLLPGEPLWGVGSYPEFSIGGWHFASLDFAKPEVREHRLKFILLMCTTYDWDGVELDFCRHPLHFKLGTEPENMVTMTGFMRRVRATIDEIGEKRGRPFVLAVRVPPTPRQALLTGLAAERAMTVRS